MNRKNTLFVILFLIFLLILVGCENQVINIDSTNTQSPTIRGTVSIPKGANVTGSDFFVRIMEGEKAVYTGKVNADGSFAVPGLEEGVSYNVLLTTVEPGNIIDGSRDISREITMGYGGWLINVSASINIQTSVGSVQVKPLGTIRGTVVREGAEDGYDTDVYIPGTSFFSTTDAEGNYAIFNVPQSTYTLRFRSVGYIAQVIEGITLFSSSDDESPVRNVSKVTLIKNTGSVEGFALRSGEADNSGIVLRLEQKESTVNLTSTTAANGYFKIDDVPPGQYRVLASYAGYLSQASDYFEVNAARVTTIAETIELGQDMGTISGTASLAGSSVKGGINISIVGEDSGTNYSTVTSEDGSFTKNVPSGSYTVTAYYPGYTSGSIEVTVTKGTTVRADIKALEGNCTIVFDSQGGSDVESINVVPGLPVGRPSDPSRYAYVFGGWYLDSACTQSYNFSSAVNESFTLYAKWIVGRKVTFDLNYEGAPAASEVWVATDTPVNAPESPELEGFYFRGWFANKDDKRRYDFTTPVTEDMTLYAVWATGEASLYRLIATRGIDEDLWNYDKFVVSFQNDEQAVVNPGDVLSFRFRSTREIQFMNIRGDRKWVYEDFSETHGMTSFEPKEDGWTDVTYEFASNYYDGSEVENDQWFRIDFGSREYVAGDILEIYDLRLNGAPLSIDTTNIPDSPGVAPILETIESGPYEWTSHVVTFNTNDGTAIDPVTVAFGGKIEKPEDPKKTGFAFDKWCADAKLTTDFNFNSPIVADTTIYAKYGEPCTVVFNGTELADVVIAKGNKLAKPADPSKAGNIFGGWYADALLETPFNFNVAIEADTTIYAKWIPIWTVTLNYNYGETPDTKDVFVTKGEVMAEPKSIARVGYFFGGWYNDKACTEAHDWTSAVSTDTTVYAKWNAPTEAYQFTSTIEDARFQFRWHEDTVAMFNGTINAGDVFTLMLKFPEDNALAEGFWRLRTRYGELHITENIDFSDTTKEGDWYMITVTVPDTIKNGSGLYLQVFGANDANWPVESVMIIKAFAYNGQAIAIDAQDYGTASTRWGAYDKNRPNGTVIVP